MWAAGQKLGSYELVANLRSGGMATLFLAKRTGASGFARPVAIKVVHPELADDIQFRQMFLDEALLSSRIQHPNVVHVEELGEHQGLHYLVMEFVHGCSLAQLTRALNARGRRLSPPFATRIAMHVADALHAAHETRDTHGRPLAVVHRDVSPENILLSYSGHVKLIDFGIAKAYGRRHKTQAGLLKGKFRYMAPEQALAKSIDRRTDIYQLGIVLWEMLTRRRLFDADSDGELLAQVRAPHIVAPSSFVAGIPPALDAAVMMALATNPKRRHPNAQVFARALAKALPAAHDVDSGALSALLLGAMQEHRSRQRATYPPGIYEGLEQQIETLRDGGGEPGLTADPIALGRCTLEDTAPYGSDAPRARGSARDVPALRAAEVTASEGAARSAPPRASQSVRPVARDRRRRRLVRLASELRTTITAIENELRGKRATWLLIGGAAGLALALVMLTLMLRPKPQRPPPALPVPVSAPLPAVIGSDPHETASSLSPASRDDSASKARAEGAAGRDAGPTAHNATPPARNRRLPALDTVDGTPLFTEPGF